MLLKVQSLSAATLYKTLQGCSNLISVSLPHWSVKQNARLLWNLLLAIYFTVQQLITESADALVACVR